MSERQSVQGEVDQFNTVAEKDNVNYLKHTHGYASNYIPKQEKWLFCCFKKIGGYIENRMSQQ